MKQQNGIRLSVEGVLVAGMIAGGAGGTSKRLLPRQPPRVPNGSRRSQISVHNKAKSPRPWMTEDFLLVCEM